MTPAALRLLIAQTDETFWEFPLFPERASSFAGQIDAAYTGLWVFTVVMTLLILFLLIFFAVKYRAGSRADRTRPPTQTTKYELVWVGIPLFASLLLFYWAADLFFEMRRVPAETLDIAVVGKQWMWKLQHPSGRREINELHVPTGQAVRLNMVSQDVIHSFFIPAFRVKMDVLPSGYTSAWFEATKPGRYHLFCAEYCGAEHSRMIGWVTVMTPAEYQAWLSGGGDVDQPMADAGADLLATLRCTDCHIAGSSARAPRLEGLFGTEVRLLSGETVTVDEDYLRRAILDPQAQIVVDEGGRPYPPIMPTFRGQISAETLNELIAYIKSIGAGEEAGGTEDISASPRGEASSRAESAAEDAGLRQRRTNDPRHRAAASRRGTERSSVSSSLRMEAHGVETGLRPVARRDAAALRRLSFLRPWRGPGHGGDDAAQQIQSSLSPAPSNREVNP